MVATVIYIELISFYTQMTTMHTKERQNIYNYYAINILNKNSYLSIYHIVLKTTFRGY